MPWWLVLLGVAAVFSWISVTLLIRNNPDEELGWFRSPSVAPLSQVWFLGGGVACAWLGGSYAADTPMGGWAYPLAALVVLLPWGIVRWGHNRRLK